MTQNKKLSRGEGGGGSTGIGVDIDKSVKTDWRKALRDFLSKTESKQFSYMRPQRNLLGHGIVMQGRRPHFQEELEVVVAIDTSGSVTQDVFRTFMSEIVSIVQKFDKMKLKVLLFHTKVYSEIDIDTTGQSYKFTEEKPPVSGVNYTKVTSKQEANNLIEQKLAHAGGGTVLTSVTDYLKQRGISKLKGLLIFTDGGCESNPIIIPAENKLFLINSDYGDPSIVKRFGPYLLVDVEHTEKNNY